MTYCISDIHGDYTRFCAMLELIHFSEEDKLYILGDAIDRGPDGVDILLDIMERKNIHMLLGNHEAMLLATLGPNNAVGARKLWTQNGGNGTYQKWSMESPQNILRNEQCVQEGLACMKGLCDIDLQKTGIE